MPLQEEVFAEAPRDVVARVWAALERGERLTGDSLKLSKAMELHPEWREVWSKAKDSPSGTRFEGRNPFVDLMLHCAVETQVEELQPPEVAQTFKRLRAAGVTQVEAIHKIGDLFSLHMSRAMRGRRALASDDYEADLRRL
jgi:hypothetical protein